MNTVIAILSEDSALKHFKEMYLKWKSTMDTRRKFIDKQIKDLVDDQKKIEGNYHKEICERLRALGKYPEKFKSGEDQIIADMDRDCVIWHTHDDQCAHKNIAQILEILIPPPKE